MFRKAMQIDDAVVFRFFELLSARTAGEIAALAARPGRGRNPMEIKALFAREIVERFHGADAADARACEFERVYCKDAVPEDVPRVGVAPRGRRRRARVGPQAGQSRRVHERGPPPVEQGGVEVDGQRVADPKALCGRQRASFAWARRIAEFARIRVGECRADGGGDWAPITVASAIACGQTGVTTRKPRSDTVSPQASPRLHLDPLVDLVPAAHLLWLVDARPAQLLADDAVADAVAIVLPASRLDAWARHYGGVDLRQARELDVVATRRPLSPLRAHPSTRTAWKPPSSSDPLRSRGGRSTRASRGSGHCRRGRPRADGPLRKRRLAVERGQLARLGPPFISRKASSNGPLLRFGQNRSPPQRRASATPRCGPLQPGLSTGAGGRAWEG